MTGTTATAESGDLRALTAAIDHARAMANQASEVRMRNFNFFIIVTGALVAGYGRTPGVWNVLFDIAGVMAALLFLGLDVRGYGLHRRSVDQLRIIEPLLWERAALSGWTAIPHHGGFWILSHRWIYRSFFVVLGTAWAIALAITLLRK